MTVKELKELLELVLDEDIIVAPDDRGIFKPAGCLAVLSSGYTTVKPGWDSDRAPRELWFPPKRTDK